MWGTSPLWAREARTLRQGFRAQSFQNIRAPFFLKTDLKTIPIFCS